MSTTARASHESWRGRNRQAMDLSLWTSRDSVSPAVPRACDTHWCQHVWIRHRCMTGLSELSRMSSVLSLGQTIGAGTSVQSVPSIRLGYVSGSELTIGLVCSAPLHRCVNEHACTWIRPSVGSMTLGGVSEIRRVSDAQWSTMLPTPVGSSRQGGVGFHKQTCV